MNKITEYYTVSESGDFKKFNAAVNEKIKEGFQPIGGVSTAMDTEALFFAQAMVKYDNRQGIGEHGMKRLTADRNMSVEWQL